MIEQVVAAAETHGWYTEKDEKKLSESLLGAYKSPRLRIRTKEKEFVVDPIACFGGGRHGIVDLVIMPTYETVYWIVLKNGRWKLVSSERDQRSKPFTRTSFVNAITKLSGL